LSFNGKRHYELGEDVEKWKVFIHSTRHSGHVMWKECFLPEFGSSDTNLSHVLQLLLDKEKWKKAFDKNLWYDTASLFWCCDNEYIWRNCKVTYCYPIPLWGDVTKLFQSDNDLCCTRLSGYNIYTE
jgi:hypothetical protein